MEFRWNEWNEEHVARHGVTPDGAEEVIRGARPPYPLVQGDERYLVWGSESSGRLLQVVFVIDPEDSIFCDPRPTADRYREEAISTEAQVRKKTSRKVSKFEKMNGRELAEATAPYGQEMVIDEFESPGPAARRRWERARRKPGRPRRGKGAKVISVSVERGLLSQSDGLARSLGLTRASLIERGLKAVLAEEGKRR